MCERCSGTGLITKPEAPADGDGNYTASHVRIWIEFMRRLGYHIRVKRCICRRKVGRRA